MFSEGFSKNAGLQSSGLNPRELLSFLSEYAAMKVFLSEFKEARELCEKGLKITASHRSRQVQEMALNLYATRANLAVRTFDYSAAIHDLEISLKIAESINSPANQAVVLNNLGIVYSNCDRYAEAIRAFRDAERTSRSLDEGPSLVSIYGNLAVLHSKTGDFKKGEEALLQARSEEGAPELPALREELSLKFSGDARAAYLESPHWKSWTSGLSFPRPEAGAPSPRPPKKISSALRTEILPGGRQKSSWRQELVAVSRPMRQLLLVLNRLRKSDLPVLIRGETGSGKELVARLIHQESVRCGEQFMVLDCAAIPAALVEAELFGAKAGAFTDLQKDRTGILSRVDEGILLIDEIGGLTLDNQAKLLRALSAGTFRRLGGRWRNTGQCPLPFLHLQGSWRRGQSREVSRGSPPSHPDYRGASPSPPGASGGFARVD